METETLGGDDLQEGNGTRRVAAREREEEEGGALGVVVVFPLLPSTPLYIGGRRGTNLGEGAAHPPYMEGEGGRRPRGGGRGRAAP